MGQAKNRTTARVIEDPSEVEIDDTASLPALSRGRQREAANSDVAATGESAAGAAESLDWLVALTKAIDKRLERIEVSIERIQASLPSEDDQRRGRRRLFELAKWRRNR